LGALITKNIVPLEEHIVHFTHRKMVEKSSRDACRLRTIRENHYQVFYKYAAMKNKGDTEMGKIIAAEYVTVDGVFEAPETWQFPYLIDDMRAFNETEINGATAFLLGRATYDIFAGYWPTQTHNEDNVADSLNSKPKFVVSSTLKQADWNHSTLINRNFMDEIGKLKQQVNGKIGISGSGTLVRSLLQAGFLDELHYLVHPIVVGHGEHLFKETEKLPLKLLSTKAFSSGVVLLNYGAAE